MNEIKILNESDLSWSFEEPLPYMYLRTTNNNTYHVKFDPFPCYQHNTELITKEIRRVESIFPMKNPVTWIILPREGVCRTNGWHTAYDFFYDDVVKDRLEKEGAECESIIAFFAKRIPIMPAMTRYLVAHEYSHAIEQYVYRKLGYKDSGPFRKFYAEEIRKIPNNPGYGGGKWASNIGEIFANDARILVFGAEEEFWPHEVEHPNSPKLKKLRKWWKEIRDSVVKPS